jgi:general stress protein 26
MSDDYEDLTTCSLSPELEQRLLHLQRECVFMWTNSDGEAFGVVMAVLPKDGRFWLTAAERRKRITALRRFPRASLCLNSTGTKMGPGKTITYKGTCTVHADRATKDWFYPEFSRWLHRDEATAAEFQRFLDSPHRVIIEFVPDYSLSFDGELMMQRSPEANW